MTSVRRVSVLMAMAVWPVLSLQGRARADIHFLPDPDSPCVHQVPNNATVYLSTGEWYSQEGTLMGTATSCSDPPVSGPPPQGGGAQPDTCSLDAGEACSSSSQCCGTDEICASLWYDAGSASGYCCGTGGASCDPDAGLHGNDQCCGNPKSRCNAYQGKCAEDFYAVNNWGVAKSYDAGIGENRAAYDYLEASWTLPNGAQVGADVDSLWFWIGFQGNGEIIQPVSHWDPANGWQIFAEVVSFDEGVVYGIDASNNSHNQMNGNYEAPPCTGLAVGDVITGTMALTEGDSTYGDLWFVGITEANGGCTSGFYFFTGLDTSPFTNVNAGVLEVHGLATCYGLPSNNGLDFWVSELGQEVSTSNKSEPVNVTSLQSFSGDGGSYGAQHYVPQCSWGAGWGYDHLYFEYFGWGAWQVP